MILLRHAFQKNLDSFKYSMLIGCLRLHNHYHTFEYKMTHWITHFMIHRYKWLIYYADIFFKKIEKIENNENRKRFSNVEHFSSSEHVLRRANIFSQIKYFQTYGHLPFFNLAKEWFILYESYRNGWTAGPIKGNLVWLSRVLFE